MGAEKLAKKGEILLFQGEPSSHIGLIVSGRAVAISYSENGTETWLGRFNAGEFFGHLSFFSKTDMRFEIRADQDTKIRLIPIAQIKTLMADAPSVGAAFAQDLAERLDTMMVRLIEALTLSAKGRVCAELIRMSHPIGVSPEQSVIRPNPVFVDLALRINSTRETVSRAISELQKDGIIIRHAGAIVIQSPTTLKSFIK